VVGERRRRRTEKKKREEGEFFFFFLRFSFTCALFSSSSRSSSSFCYLNSVACVYLVCLVSLWSRRVRMEKAGGEVSRRAMSGDEGEGEGEEGEEEAGGGALSLLLLSLGSDDPAPRSQTLLFSRIENEPALLAREARLA
jgi:hypothetical protein